MTVDAALLLTPTPSERTDGPTATVRRWLLAGVGGLALALGLFRIGRPAPWGDEAVTVIVVRRSWSGILALSGGADAPMILYYLLAKAWSTALGWLPTLTAVRSLSAVAAALAVVCLAAVAARLSGLAAGVGAGGVLMLLPGFTRYAQEARPYALLVLATTAGWLAWAAWRRPEPGRDGPGVRRVVGSPGGALAYLATLAAAPLLHLFGLLQWPAQLLADLTAPGLAWRARWRRVLLTGGAMVAVLLVVGYPVLSAMVHGTAAAPRQFSRIRNVLAQTITAFTPIEPALPVLVLAGLGLVAGLVRTGVTSPHRDLVRVAALWFLVPLGLGIGLALTRPVLLRARYWQPLLAPLAALAAVALVALAHAVFVLLAPTGTGARRRAVAALAAAAVGLGGVAALVVAAVPHQIAIRQSDGHRVRLAPAVTKVAALLADDPDLPVLVSPRSRSVILVASRPEWTARNPLIRIEDAGTSAWPVEESAEVVAARLLGHDTAVWVLADRGPTKRPVAAPAILDGTGFELVEVSRAGTWWVAVLQR